MKTRAEIKALAKESFRLNYWPLVGIVALYTVINARLVYTGVGSAILTAPIMTGFFFVMISCFSGMGCDVGAMFTKGFENFGRKLGGYWWMQLFLFLWFLIPIAGLVLVVIKSLSYAMTMYILSDCPNVKAKDALALSKRMMKGHKWELFVFQLSFIGWHILSLLTCGVLYIFWTAPFCQLSFAGYYLELREDCLRRGVITTDELDGAPLMNA